MQNHILSIILFTPLVGALILLFVPRENKDAIRWIANLFALGGFLVSLPLVPWFWAQMQSPARFKFIEGTPNNWIPSIGAGYVLGIDGISFLLIMLTTLLGWISILSSWTAIETRAWEHFTRDNGEPFANLVEWLVYPWPAGVWLGADRSLLSLRCLRRKPAIGGIDNQRRARADVLYSQKHRVVGAADVTRGPALLTRVAAVMRCSLFVQFFPLRLGEEFLVRIPGGAL